MQTLAGLKRAAAFTRWLGRALTGSLYPGAPFERRHMALRLLDSWLTAWEDPHKAMRGGEGPGLVQGCRRGAAGPLGRDAHGDWSGVQGLITAGRRAGVEFLPPGFLGPSTVKTLLGAIL